MRSQLLLSGMKDGWLTQVLSKCLMGFSSKPINQGQGYHGTLTSIRCATCDYYINLHKPQDFPFLLSTTKCPLAFSDFLHCPECANVSHLGLVWCASSKSLPKPDSVDESMSEGHIDLVIAAETSLEVFLAAEWVSTARAYGEHLWLSLMRETIDCWTD
ncbi:hypothetical protein DM02DRAFT_618630 [Periconia macrospinosa]|uniref:Uncharacterized protein n=1 Tax=Periconia macrospinosa TaxID=97972 RepID=A0A2V1D8Q4_9PLEO|nr:hypothetical protein DM02DRAFT_618630 [Periconia macrospinosa]